MKVLGIADNAALCLASDNLAERAALMADTNPINGVPFGRERSREEYLARATWEYEQAARLRDARRPVGYAALADAHERAAKHFERAAEERPSSSRSATTASAHATKRIPKTKLVHVVQGNYGYGHGWEDLTAEDDRKEGRERLREYRANELGVPFRLIRRREKIAPPTGANHARRKKLDPHEAKRRLQGAGVDFGRDFHELSRSTVDLIVETAKEAGYRKRRDAPGSTARMYFQYLSRLR